jgi:hypothetical protein
MGYLLKAHPDLNFIDNDNGLDIAYIPHPHRAPLWVSSAVSYLPGP